MVRGIGEFRRHFRSYPDRYVLIGGAACDILMETAGLEFRATKDLDIVLILEALDAAFARAIWDFVRAGGYQAQENAAGGPRYYRFIRPKNEDYPWMVELFARKPDMLYQPKGVHITPIPTEEGISSLSAILVSDDYYDFIRSGRRIIDGISVIGPEFLIPLKARAWLDLKSRKEVGADIDARSIAKHKNDVFRLFRLIEPVFRDVVPAAIAEDMSAFLAAMQNEPVDLKSMGITSRKLSDVISDLRNKYAFRK